MPAAHSRLGRGGQLPYRCNGLRSDPPQTPLSPQISRGGSFSPGVRPPVSSAEAWMIPRPFNEYIFSWYLTYTKEHTKRLKISMNALMDQVHNRRKREDNETTRPLESLKTRHQSLTRYNVDSVTCRQAVQCMKRPWSFQSVDGAVALGPKHLRH